MPQEQIIKVNVNLASLKELMAVKGLGPSLSQMIIDQRPYEYLTDLVRVSGINELKLASLLPFLTAEKPTVQEPSSEKLIDKIGDTQTELTKDTNKSPSCPFMALPKDLLHAFLVVLGGFFLGWLILLLRRKCK